MSVPAWPELAARAADPAGEFFARLAERGYPLYGRSGELLAEAAAREDGEAVTYCPLHESSGAHDPSLSVAVVREDGGERVLTWCFPCAESPFTAIMRGEVAECTATRRDGGWHSDGASRQGGGGGKLVAALEIRSGADYAAWCEQVASGIEDVDYLCGHEFSKVRWDGVPGKRFKAFRWYRRIGGQWKRGLFGAVPPLYGAESVKLGDDSPVWAVEGEKDADALISRGLAAVSTTFVTGTEFAAAGVKQAVMPDVSCLAGREVFVIPDADETGDLIARTFAQLARQVTNMVAVLAPLGERKGYDASDWLADGHDVLELLPHAQATAVLVTPDAAPAEPGEDEADASIAQCNVHLDDFNWKCPKCLRERRQAELSVQARELEAAQGPWLFRSAAAYAEVQQPPSVIDGVLAAEINNLGGPSAAGKSLLLRDWAGAVATGTPWRGHEVPERRLCLIVATEGLNDFRERWAACPWWEAARELVFILDRPVDLVTPAGLERFMREAREALPEPPGLVGLDVIYGMGMSDDNGSKDVIPVITSMKTIAAEWRAAVVPVGHPPHSGERRFRGSSMWRQLAATDWHLASGMLTCEKSKIANASSLAVPCVVEYPFLRYPAVGDVLAREAERRLIIRADLAAHPGGSVLARARRLMPALGLEERAARAIISAVIRDIENEPPAVESGGTQ